MGTLMLNCHTNSNKVIKYCFWWCNNITAKLKIINIVKEQLRYHWSFAMFREVKGKQLFYVTMDFVSSCENSWIFKWHLLEVCETIVWWLCDYSVTFKLNFCDFSVTFVFDICIILKNLLKQNYVYAGI